MISREYEQVYWQQMVPQARVPDIKAVVTRPVFFPSMGDSYPAEWQPSAAEWELVVSDMRFRGARGSDDEEGEVVKHVVQDPGRPLH